MLLLYSSLFTAVAVDGEMGVDGVVGREARGELEVEVVIWRNERMDRMSLYVVLYCTSEFTLPHASSFWRAK